MRLLNTLSLFALCLPTPAAAQWAFKVGEIVQSKALTGGTSWEKCRVLEQGPGGGNYLIACLMPWSREKEYWSEGHVHEADLRVMPAALAAVTPAQAAASAGRFRIGQTVLASSTDSGVGATRCVVLDRMPAVVIRGEQPNDSYQVRCVIAYPDTYGRPVQALRDSWAKDSRMKPDDPSFHPEWRIATAQAQDAARAARISDPRQAASQVRPDGPARVVRPGNYECWSGSSARLNMNFTITGLGGYRNASGAGRFSKGADGRLSLTGPMLEAMPKGFVAVYHEHHGKPTVSFRGPSGGEAAFCERAG